jgi:hypothetical protein
METSTKKYFDLKAYFQKEVVRLTKNPPEIKKVVQVNGEREERTIDSIDFKKELSPFFDADINRAAWSDKYKTDSIFNDRKTLTQIVYTALDDKLITRKISLNFESNMMQKVIVVNNASSMVASTQQKLQYAPKEGYFIESYQKVALGKENFFLIEVLFTSH